MGIGGPDRGERAAAIAVVAPWWAALWLAACAPEVASGQATTVAALPRVTAPAVAEQARADAPRADSAPSSDAPEPTPDAAATATQDEPGEADAEPPPFVHVPIEDPSGTALRAFHVALRRAERGDGQARIVFYGASHVASDLFTDVVRERLQERFGDAGAGFVLPAKPWRWYRHAGFAIEKSRGFDGTRVKARAPVDGLYGLAGVALDANTRNAIGAIETRAHGASSGRARRLELFYLKQPKGGTLTVFIDGQRAARLRTAADHSTPAYALFELEDAPHRFEVRTQANGPVRIFGVSFERDTPGVILDTLGIPGARARYHLNWDDALYREHLARRAPDLVVLAYGTNESGDDDVPIESYEQRLRTVVARVREVAPTASCLLVGPSDRPVRVGDDAYEPRPRTRLVVDTQRAVARDLGCGFFDMVAFMGGPMSMVRWTQMPEPMGTPDHVHYTRRGYEALGEVLTEALLAGYVPASDAPSEPHPGSASAEITEVSASGIRRTP